jgi:hypothetical protein
MEARADALPGWRLGLFGLALTFIRFPLDSIQSWATLGV